MSDTPAWHVPAHDTITPNRQGLRFGGALAVIGGLGYFLTLLLHGDLPDQTTAIALEHIGGRPEWQLLKLALMMAVLCWIGGFIALVQSLPAGLSTLLGRWAVSSAVIGASIMVVEYAIIGHALKNLADAWLAAPSPAAAQAMVSTADVMLAITGGLFHSFVALMLGLPFLLLGMAIVCGQGYPRWLGWVAVVAGSGALVAGSTRFLDISLVPYPLLYGGFVLPLSIWLAAMGVLMWHRARLATRGVQ